eukprot:CAMPEP_0197689832 /NCGR_PEP_ID=MMETSP1338-20131121/107451_1 /TAXON_ID=43686 ORGANISM="Pelagodinium beii, Strain RCC1491" /NCGR_SAMPLE_ID=MMETSP1338 /ASSEMBLY_ACC=CAM_ASM_000754 /LENGTH=122 /DNA_ID=CAMNT_0043272215 /DNA_START=103 /DNA_END=471 /DNA_ORIENTATION=+
MTAKFWQLGIEASASAAKSKALLSEVPASGGRKLSEISARLGRSRSRTLAITATLFQLARRPAEAAWFLMLFKDRASEPAITSCESGMAAAPKVSAARKRGTKGGCGHNEDMSTSFLGTSKA